MSNINELLKKLKKLAEQGIDGEKDNAQKILERICIENNISIDDIESDELIESEFIYTPDLKFLFVQISCTVLNLTRLPIVPLIHITKKAKDINKNIIQCTLSESIQIRAMFDLYSKKYLSDLDNFQQAFLYKNGLFPDVDSGEESKMSEEEIKRIVKISNSLDKHEMPNNHKQLNF